jgi:hypothetical protein
VCFSATFFSETFSFREEMSEILSKKYIGLEVKQPLFVIDFNETGIWKIDFPINSKKNMKFHDNPS